MRVAAIELKNYKRFTHLVVRDIPDTAKLVVVVGPNGCGKSSLFSGMLHWYRNLQNTHTQATIDELFHRKDKDAQYEMRSAAKVSFADGEAWRAGCVYVRSAYRNDPDFSVDTLSRPPSPTEKTKLERVIDNDQTVKDNYQRLVLDTIAGVYGNDYDGKPVEQLRDDLIGGIRRSMQAVFGDLALNNITDPLGAKGAFTFDKGAAKSYHYKNLSGGEKAAFDLLLDLHLKKRVLGGAIYCIDEVETHLHTRVQGTLVRELVKILPDDAQLWVTTHSLGVLRAAQAMSFSEPGKVALIDFSGVDPDVPAELVPSNLNRATWEKMLSITLDDLSPAVAPRVVVMCEGSSLGARRRDFDAEIYNRVLASQTHDVVFVSGGNSGQVVSSAFDVAAALRGLLPSSNVVALCDLDDKSPSEVARFEAGGNLVLKRRNIESYLLDDEIIEALVTQEGKPALLADALKIKADALNAMVAQGKPSDDLKSASGLIYVGLKKLLGLARPGNNSDAFLRDTLAPLITPTTRNVYRAQGRFSRSIALSGTRLTGALVTGCAR